MITIPSAQIKAAPGDVDSGFNPNPNGAVYSTAVQPDGKILIGGTFTSVGGVPRNRLARLSSDGSLDAGFNPNVSSAVYSIAVLADGRILIGGGFSLVGGTTQKYIARLNTNGTRDSTFNPTFDSNSGNRLYTTAVQADGKIVIGGVFTNVNGVTRNYLARLNDDGTLDAGFDANVSEFFVDAISFQPDGKLVVGGAFTRVGGLPHSGLVRLSTNGTVEPGFNINAIPFVNTTAVRTDGTIMIGGSFGSIGGFSRRGLALFSPEGTLDLDFDPDLGGYVYSTASQVDGKIIVGGAFSTSPPAPRAYLARLNANGTLDSGFATDADGIVHSTAVLADGRILMAGEFTTVGGTPRNYLAILANDPAPQNLAVSATGHVQWQRAGASPETSRTIFELSIDGGTTWSALGVGTRISGGWELTGLNLPAAGLVRGRATVLGGQYNAGTGLIETMAAFSVAATPAPKLTTLSRVGNGVFQFSFTNLNGKVFTAIATTNLSLPATNWTVLGPATEISPGHYQFMDQEASNLSLRFYQIRSP